MDNGLTRKEAEMELTRERINTGFDALKLAAEACSLNVAEVEKLRDLALRALSLESVREEALEEVINRLGKEYVEDRDGADDAVYNAAVGYCIGAVRALQHAPARVAEYEPTPDEIIAASHTADSSPESPAKEQPGELNAAPQVSLPARMGREAEADSRQVESATSARANPAAAAPDVAAMVKRFERYAESAQKTADTAIDDRNRSWAQGRATAYRRCAKDIAMIEKLGQHEAWFPSVELTPCKRCGAQRTKLPDDSPPPPERP